MRRITKSKRILALLVSLCMVFTLVPAVAFADDSVSLTVKQGSSVSKTYTEDQLKAIAGVDLGADDPANYLTYSAVNNANTFDTVSGAWGPEVKTLLFKAGVDIGALKPDTKITFTSGGSKPFSVALTWGQITGKAYYYPNAEKAKGGEKAGAESQAGAVAVPAIIDLKGSDPKKGDTCLVIGQASPNDINKSSFNYGMAKGGTITVESAPAEQLKSVEASAAPGVVAPSTKIELSAADGSIYYTTDGTDPSKMSYLYNYNTKASPQTNREITAPATVGTFTVKAYATKYGKADSPVSTLTYKVATTRVKSAKLNMKSAAIAKKAKKQLKVTFTPSDASVKDVTWKSSNSKVAKVDSKGKVTGVARGIAKVTATTLDGQKKLTCTFYVGGPKKVALKKVRSTKNRALTATWKRNSKATGYQLTVATNKSFSKNKKFAYVKKNRTTVKTITKLKKGKKYYVKVRPYKTVKGKKIYGAYSSVKKVKVR